MKKLILLSVISLTILSWNIYAASRMPAGGAGASADGYGERGRIIGSSAVPLTEYDKFGNINLVCAYASAAAYDDSDLAKEALARLTAGDKREVKKHHTTFEESVHLTDSREKASRTGGHVRTIYKVTHPSILVVESCVYEKEPTIVAYAGSDLGMEADRVTNAAISGVNFGTLANKSYYKRERYKGGDYSEVYAHIKLPASHAVYEGYALRFGQLEHENRIVAKVITETYGSTGTIFTGHSMGGSLAQLAALYAVGLKKEGEECLGTHPLSIIGFGTPPLFNAPMVSTLDSYFPGDSHRQFRAGGDPVPYIHDWNQAGLYVDCGVIIKDAKGEKMFTKGRRPDPSVVKSYNDALAGVRVGNSVIFSADIGALKAGASSHSISTYVNALMTGKAPAGHPAKTEEDDGCQIM